MALPKHPRMVLQFKITLMEISPPIWRRIQIPADSTFWTLHVAIQDAMGWLDYHLHEFLLGKGRSRISIGIPDSETEPDDMLPGWEEKASARFRHPGEVASYIYDFGDGWTHELIFEGAVLLDSAFSYPRCVEGARACPPEDCGGPAGYERLLAILANKKHAEHKDFVRWLTTGHVRQYYPFNSELFDPATVFFESSAARLRKALGPRKR